MQIKEDLIMSLAKILAAFRLEGVSVTNPTEFLVPDSIRYLNLYSLGALKSPAFKLLGEIKADEKLFWVLKFLGNSMSKMIKIASPRMYKISDIQSSMTYYGYQDEETGKFVKPPLVDNKYSNMTSDDLLIIDDGEFIYLYVGRNLPNDLIYDIFGYEDVPQMQHYGVDTLAVQMDTDAYIRIMNIIEQLRGENQGAYQPIKVVLEGSILHKQLKMYSMIEDTLNKNREFTYQDFLNHLHNIIRTQ